MLQFLEIGNLPLDIRQFLFQTLARRSAGLQAAPSQIQKVANFFESEPQVLHASNEVQRLDVALAVSSIPSE
jgi:hypothetical protein